MWKREALRLAGAIVVVLVILILAGAVVEIVNHVGIVSGLGFSDQIARALVDAATFAVSAFVLYGAWRGEL